MINILEKVSDKNDLCYISSKTKYSLGLSYVIKYNEKFLDYQPLESEFDEEEE